MIINQIKEIISYQKHLNSEPEEVFKVSDILKPDERKKINRRRFMKCFERLRHINPEDKKYLPEIIQNLIPKEQPENHSKAINVFCHLSNDDEYGNTLQDALLIDQYYRDRQLEEQGPEESLKAKRRGQSSKQYSKNDLEEFLSKYQMSQLRLRQKVIGSMNKTNITHHYYQSEEQRERSKVRRARIQSVTEKLNKNKLSVVQNFFKNDLTIKKQQYCDVIQFLAEYDDKDVPKRLQNFIIHNRLERTNKKQEHKLLLKKTFFRYCNKNDPDLNQIFKFVTIERFYDLFIDLKIEVELQVLTRVYDIQRRSFSHDMDQTRDTSRLIEYNKVIGLNYNQFIEALSQVALMMDDQYFKFQDEEINQYNCQSRRLQQFVERHLIPNKHIILAKYDYQLQLCKHYDDFKKEMEIFLRPLFLLDSNQDDPKSLFLILDDIIRLFTKIRIFPKYFTKSIVRYYYQYNLRHDEGLNFQDFQECLNQLALYLPNKKVTLSKEPQVVANYYMRMFQLRENIDDDSLAIYKRLLAFYLHPEYMDAMQFQH